MKEILEEHWHHLPETELFEFLETSAEKGLDSFEVAHRREQSGPNRITQKKGTSPLVLFLLQFLLCLYNIRFCGILRILFQNLRTFFHDDF